MQSGNKFIGTWLTPNGLIASGIIVGGVLLFTGGLDNVLKSLTKSLFGAGKEAVKETGKLYTGALDSGSKEVGKVLGTGNSYRRTRQSEKLGVCPTDEQRG